MSKKIKYLILSLLIVLPLQAITVDEILEKFVRTLTIPSLQGNFKVQLIASSGDTREIEAKVYQKQIGDTQNNRLFLFDFPPTVRGTGLLLHSYYDERENNMWIYLPAVRRIKRIALESSGGGYFMGSDFTYRDMINNDISDLEFELLSDTTIDGIEYYVLKAWGNTPQNRQDNGYSFTLSYHRKDNFMLYKREYYDMNEELLKIYLAEKYLDFPPAIYPSKISMTNVQTGHKSIIEVSDISTDDIPDRYFTTRYLQNN